MSQVRILFATRDILLLFVPHIIYENELLRVTQYTLRVCIPTKKHQDGPCGYLGVFCMCKCRDSRGEAEDVASIISKYNNLDVAHYSRIIRYLPDAICFSR